jgi:hypothetical protein
MSITVITAYETRSIPGMVTAPVGFTADTFQRAVTMTAAYTIVPVTMDEAEEWLTRAGRSQTEFYVYVAGANGEEYWVDGTGRRVYTPEEVEHMHDAELDERHAPVLVASLTATFYGGQHYSMSRILRRVDKIAYDESVRNFAVTLDAVVMGV